MTKYNIDMVETDLVAPAVPTQDLLQRLDDIRSVLEKSTPKSLLPNDPQDPIVAVPPRLRG